MDWSDEMKGMKNDQKTWDQGQYIISTKINLYKTIRDLVLKTNLKSGFLLGQVLARRKKTSADY